MSPQPHSPPAPACWYDAAQTIPDNDRIVLLHSSDGCGPTGTEPDVWPGWRDEQESCWYWADGGLAETIIHWAEMPEAPKPKSKKP